MDGDSELEEAMERLLSGMGLSLVELSIGRRRGSTNVHLVLYREGGIGLDHLSRAQKVLRPTLELEFGRENLSVEIASPGTSRRIKDPREYGIFIGRRIRLLIGEEWTSGELRNFDGESIDLRVEESTRKIAVEAVRKARLDEDKEI